MANELVKVSAASVPTTAKAAAPAVVERAGGAARFAWDEFFYAEHRNPHTQKAYQRAVRRFLAWVENEGVELPAVTPRMVGDYLSEDLGGSPSKQNLHLAAVRGFFDRLVQRHVCVLNPAATVKGVKEEVVEGKTPEITVEQARTLLGSIKIAKTVKNQEGQEIAIPLVVGLRDRAILATMAFTGCRGGAVARLRLGDFQDDGRQYVLRFREKGGKSREIPVRHDDLEGYILAYIEAAGIAGEPKDSPLFRAGINRSAKRLSDRPLTTDRIGDMMKRRLKDAGLPTRLSPHSFRVKTATNLLEQNVPLEDVQHLLGHAEPRTTALYDRRKKQVTRNIVERIPI
jgi:site-specific recombinase XerD